MKSKRTLEESLADLADTKARALSPPTALVEMRLIYHGQKPANAGQEALLKFFKSDEKGFFAQMFREEKNHRDFVKEMTKSERPAVQDNTGRHESLPDDEGTLKAQDLIQRVLAEANAKIHHERPEENRSGDDQRPVQCAA